MECLVLPPLVIYVTLFAVIHCSHASDPISLVVLREAHILNNITTVTSMFVVFVMQNLNTHLSAPGAVSDIVSLHPRPPFLVVPLSACRF
jgi:hypothetical protein